MGRCARIRAACLAVAYAIAGFLLFDLAPGSWLQAQETSRSNRGIAGGVKVKGQGAPMVRIEVTLLSNDRRPIERVFADSLGSFQFLGLSPGLYLVVIDERGYQRIEDQVEIPPRSQGLQRRYYLLEPAATETSSKGFGIFSAKKFVVSKEARQALESGERELSKQRYSEAAKHFDRALSIEPSFAQALSARALLHLQQNELEASRALFAQACASDPQLSEAHLGLGTVFNRQGTYDQAIKPLSDGLALNPRSYIGHFERGRAYFQLGRMELAESDCNKARQLSSEPRPELNVLLGNIYLSGGRDSEALREFEAYLNVVSDSPIAAQVKTVVHRLRDTGVRPAK